MDWMGLAFGYVGQTVFLTVALFIMLKLQSLQWNFPGLVGSAALACALDHVPYVGWELSGVVLLLCITKLIGSRTATDAIFTVGIAFAITFAFNMFVLTALIGDLRPSARVRARTAASEPVRQANFSQNQPVAAAAAFVKTPAVDQPQISNAAAGAVAPSPNPVAPETAPEPVVNTNQLKMAQLAGAVLKNFAIKGVSEGGAVNIAMIGNGTKTYDVAPGDYIQLDTSGGPVAAKCESVTESNVVLSVDGVRVTLTHR